MNFDVRFSLRINFGLFLFGISIFPRVRRKALNSWHVFESPDLGRVWNKASFFRSFFFLSFFFLRWYF